MISYGYPLSVGNAIYIPVTPPCDSQGMRVLRRFDGDFTGEDDPDAFVVYEGEPPSGVVDHLGLPNGVEAFYCAYSWDGAEWTASDVVSATPGSRIGNLQPDLVDIVRERIEVGLNDLVQRGVLAHESGAFQVAIAPPVFEESVFPVVAVELSQDTDDVRFIGELIGEGRALGNSPYPWLEVDGYLSRVIVSCTVWSLNPDERRLLRRALKAILIANLGVFNAAGAQNVGITLADEDDFKSFSVPVYMVMSSVSATWPSALEIFDREIKEVVETFDTVDPAPVLDF
ncbi:MAG: hypothetical protein E6Q97_04145 [Desulfurellales bacterium]|nr:MAG: hypothetical protein E6Q97_04145 [Desulfurellales bacterium]